MLSCLWQLKMDFTSQVMKGTTFRLHIQTRLPSSSQSSTNSSRRSSARLSAHSSMHPLPSNSGNNLLITPKALSTNQLSRGFITALCIDNNPLRAQVTCSYLHRVGATAHPIVMPFPATIFGCQLRQEAHCGKPSSAPGSTPKEAPNVIFIEMEQSGGKWYSPISKQSGHSSPVAVEPIPSPLSRSQAQRSVTARMSSRIQKRQGSVLSQRLAWARSFAGQQVSSGEGQREIPVVLLSNVQDAALEVEAKSAGFLCVVVKPLRKSTLAACLKLVLRRTCIDKLSPLQEDTDMTSKRRIELDDSLAGKKVLVVDDNAVNRKVASKTLEKYKLDVTCVDSAEGAMEILAGSHGFHIILTDIQMPGMDGCEMTRAIRSAEKEGQSIGPDMGTYERGVPIVAMTADVMKGSVDGFLECGMNGMVAKPIEEARLLQLIREFLFLEVE